MQCASHGSIKAHRSIPPRQAVAHVSLLLQVYKIVYSDKEKEQGCACPFGCYHTPHSARRCLHCHTRWVVSATAASVLLCDQTEKSLTTRLGGSLDPACQVRRRTTRQGGLVLLHKRSSTSKQLPPLLPHHFSTAAQCSGGPAVMLEVEVLCPVCRFLNRECGRGAPWIYAAKLKPKCSGAAESQRHLERARWSEGWRAYGGSLWDGAMTVGCSVVALQTSVKVNLLDTCLFRLRFGDWRQHRNLHKSVHRLRRL